MSGWQRTGGGGVGGGSTDKRNANSAAGGERWEDDSRRSARGGGGGELAAEERDQLEEEYFFVHGPAAGEEEYAAEGGVDPRRARRRQRRPQSRASDSATIHFLTDDREETRGDGAPQMLARDRAEIHLSQPLFRQNPPLHQMGEVDYSSNDFRQAKAAIEDAATRQQNDGPSGGRGSSGRRSAESGRKVRHFGDTTVITEHRDPYSFYWQLDKLKRAEREPPKAMPPADYILEDEQEEEEVEDEQEEAEGDEFEEDDEFPEDYLSPDSGVHLMEREPPFMERHYARPMKEWGESDPSHFSHYWQVDSGPTRHEETPPPMPAELRRKRPESPPTTKEIRIDRSSPPKQISVSEVGQQTVPLAEEPLIEEHAFRQTTTRRRVEMTEEAEEAQRQQQALTNGPTDEAQLCQFVVLPLGQVEVFEGDLCDMEQSQEALNRAMAQLRNATVREGGEAVIEISDRELRLLEPTGDGNGQRRRRLLSKEPLEHIRVWGIDGQGDFAYVSRHPTDGRLFCRVFRCLGDDSQAKNIANALQKACQTALLSQQPRDRPNHFNSSLSSSRRRRRTRESNLTTPIEEPKRIIRCHFVGVTQVPRATGIETLNEAVDKLLTEVGPERWTKVDVHISPSLISVFESGGARRQIASCRVRYLSFLGIGRDVKHCAFIVAQSFCHFVCYVFHADPSAASLAKTIEAACKLRYQKVMDAHLPENGE